MRQEGLHWIYHEGPRLLLPACHEVKDDAQRDLPPEGPALELKPRGVLSRGEYMLQQIVQCDMQCQ